MFIMQRSVHTSGKERELPSRCRFVYVNSFVPLRLSQQKKSCHKISENPSLQCYEYVILVNYSSVFTISLRCKLKNLPVLK